MFIYYNNNGLFLILHLLSKLVIKKSVQKMCLIFFLEIYIKNMYSFKFHLQFFLSFQL
jgi:hypothetical protein